MPPGQEEGGHSPQLQEDLHPGGGHHLQDPPHLHGPHLQEEKAERRLQGGSERPPTPTGINISLEDMARSAGQLLAPVEGFGLRPRIFLPFGQIKGLLCHFWFLVITSVTLVVILIKKKYPKNSQEIKKLQKKNLKSRKTFFFFLSLKI